MIADWYETGYLSTCYIYLFGVPIWKWHQKQVSKDLLFYDYFKNEKIFLCQFLCLMRNLSVNAFTSKYSPLLVFIISFCRTLFEVGYTRLVIIEHRMYSFLDSDKRLLLTPNAKVGTPPKNQIWHSHQYAFPCPAECNFIGMPKREPVPQPTNIAPSWLHWVFPLCGEELESSSLRSADQWTNNPIDLNLMKRRILLVLPL